MNHVFVNGNAALDFIGTLKWRRSGPEDLLASPSDLSEWITESGLVSEPLQVDSADLVAARELREALYDVVWAKMIGGPIAADALSEVNRFTVEPPVTPSMTETSVILAGSFEAVMSSIARSVLDAVSATGEKASVSTALLKECGREECTRIFLDRSRGHRRNWCGMEECGNRINAAAYRRRRTSRSST